MATASRESSGVPRWIVPRVSAPWSGAGEPSSPAWESIPSLPPFRLANGSGPAAEQTAVRLAHDGEALYVLFDCDDRDPWGTYTRRDDPIWQEEAVEVFLAPGERDPVDYVEFEVSPRGVLFDARVHNPTSTRENLRVDVAWNCPGIRWATAMRPDGTGWRAALSLPLGSIARAVARAVSSGRASPVFWRANFYRIERPRPGAPEFSAWSPTFTDPPDFHKPAFFGRLDLESPSASTSR